MQFPIQQEFTVHRKRLNPETCKNGCINTNPENQLKNDGWICERCGAIITRCDSLNTVYKND
jgi:hypothetical protein